MSSFLKNNLLLAVCFLLTIPGHYAGAQENTPVLPPLDISDEASLPTEKWEALSALPPKEAGQEKESHTVWTCSMHPNIQLPESGQCPICFMDLIEVALDSGSLFSLRQVELSNSARKLARVETMPVTRGSAAVSVRMAGKIDYDETLVSSITAWISGRIDNLHVDYTGSGVEAGQPMAEIYSPELLTAQAELVEAVTAAGKLNGSKNDMLRKTIGRTEIAARKKLQLLGLTDEQIDALVSRKTPSDHVTLTAPISGIVINKQVTEGMYVKTGAPIYTIADLSRLWVVLEAYESDLHAIALNQVVEFTTEAYPGKQFAGRIVYIDPVVNDKTRTIRVRMNIDNTGLLLKPGMFVRAVAQTVPTDDSVQPLLIPASAPLVTGKRAIVYVQLPDKEGVYEGREVVLGPRRGDFYQVVSGLEEGENVVVRGNFKLDSAVQIQGRPSMMNPYIIKESMEPVELPSLFGSKLNLLNGVFVKLSGALHAGENRSLVNNRDTFEKILTSIQPDFLDQGIKLDWQELAMLLHADMTLLKEAENRDDLVRIYTEMATHFYQVRTRFHLPMPVLAKEGNEQLRLQLEKLLNGYLELQRDLAGDSPEKSLAQVPVILKGIEGFIPELSSTGSEKIASIQNELESAVGQLRTSSDLAGLRAAFYPLSRALVAAVSTFGVSGSYAVYEHYCPMAFNDTGANWLDTSEVISNPYFGDEMLRCGEVLSQLKLED